MPSMPTARFTDIPPTYWLDRHLPEWAIPYARLVRLDRPIGTWLLLLPCWWGLAYADPRGIDLWLMTIFALGAVIMRGAGCVINDIYDRELDRQVARTKNRPIASGQIGVGAALVFLALLLITGLRVLTWLNRPTIFLGVASLLLVFTYPLMKRITWWPQLFLGFTFNWGVLMGWTAERGSFGWQPLILYSAAIFWTLGYDTIYAHQDIDDDAQIGVKSTARLFGRYARLIVTGFYLLTLACLALAGFCRREGIGFYVGLGVALIFALQLLAKWKPADPAASLAAFRANRDFGFIVLVAILLGKWF